MAEQRNRSTLVGVLVLAMIVIAVVITMFRAFRDPKPRTVTLPRASTAPATRTAQPNRATPSWPGFTFSDGTFWQLTGLREHPDGQAWWGGDGLPIREPKAPPASVNSAGPGMRMVEFRYRSTGDDDAFLRRFQFIVPGQQLLAHHWQPQSHIAFTGSVVVAVPETLETFDIQVGLAGGPRRDLVRKEVSFSGASTQPTLRSTTGPSQPTTGPGAVSFGDIVYRDGSLHVELFDRRTAEQRDESSGNLCVLTRNGKSTHWTGFAREQRKQFYTFALPRPQIAAVAYQTRAYLWQTLSNVPLRPGVPTTMP